MAKYNLQLKTTDAGTGKARTLNLSNVNPEASANTLKQFTQQLNQLTTNTYVETDYIVTTNLDTDDDTRQTPTLSVSNVPTLAEINSGTGTSSLRTITYNGDGVTYIYRKSGCEKIAFSFYSNTELLITKANSGVTATAGVIVVGATGTNNYRPVEVEYTIE